MKKLFKTASLIVGVASIIFFISILSPGFAQSSPEPPKITGSPKIVTPRLLPWPKDFEPTNLDTDLFEPTSNRLWDLHLGINDCKNIDLNLSTSGNYHMALTRYWYEVFKPSHPEIENFFFTTSPPISVPSAKGSPLTIGNLSIACPPTIAVGPSGIMDQLKAAQLADAPPTPFIQNQGNVLLVQKGNPKGIRDVWDLARRNIRVATSNPNTEPGSFGNYSSSIYQIALNSYSQKPRRLTPEKLFNSIFNSKKSGKWVAGERIHHREVPYLIASGAADAGPIFYHLALYCQRTFPDLFDIVPLGGTVESPEPLEGNRIATLFFIPINALNLTEEQSKARDNLMDAFMSEEFTQYLNEAGLVRPS